MSLFFYFITFAIKLWHQNFVTAGITAVLVNNQHMVFSHEYKILIKRLYLKGYTARRLTDELQRWVIFIMQFICILFHIY